MQDNNSVGNEASGIGGSNSNRLRPGQPQHAETSNLQELSASVLLTPGMQSNFRRQRGFLDVNRLLHAPVFNREHGSVLAGGAQA